MRRKPKPEDVERIMRDIMKHMMVLGERYEPDDAQYFFECLMYALPSAMVNVMATFVEEGWFDEQLVRRDLTNMEKSLVRSFDMALSGKGGMINVSEGN